MFLQQAALRLGLMYTKLLGCASVMLVLGTLASAQTSVKEIDIDSGWGGLGTPQSAHLVIKKLNGDYRLNGKRAWIAMMALLYAKSFVFPRRPRSDAGVMVKI